MRKNSEIEKLLLDHVVERPIVFDGIVDEDTFYSSAQRFLFLLKDVNGTMSSEKSIDYNKNPSFISITRERALEQEDAPDNWKPICYWTEAFKYPDKSFKEAARCGKNLMEVAIVNLKKVPGKGSADPKELCDAAKRYGDILIKEIRIISPTIIICGGTYGYAKDICKSLGIFAYEDSDMSSGSKCFVTDDGLRFVDFVHPSVRVTLAATYAYAKEISKNLGLSNKT